jgi:PI3-kinase family, ras-binding domain
VPQTTYTLQVAVESALPDTVIEMALRKRSTCTGAPMESAENFVLKVCGRVEYFLGNYPLSQFKVQYSNADLLVAFDGSIVFNINSVLSL